MDLDVKQQKLTLLSRQISSCRGCPLYKSATQAVPGEGNPDSKIVFIGEGPGYYEDQQGRPFVGQSGQLLNYLLQLIEVGRRDVWIGNVIKHRPPQNRDPFPEEIEACKIWIDKQVEIINPEIIVTLGRFSMAKFLPLAKISLIHGRNFMVKFMGKERKVVPMFHPAAALRKAEVMKMIKEDFLKLKNELA
jgi:DNA polymerase